MKLTYKQIALGLAAFIALNLWRSYQKGENPLEILGLTSVVPAGGGEAQSVSDQLGPQTTAPSGTVDEPIPDRITEGRADGGNSLDPSVTFER